MNYRLLLTSNADLRRLWTGQVVSEIGDWLNNIAVLALTLQLAGAGHEGAAISVYAIARHLPLFFFGPIAGVTVDRLSRKRVMIAADIARAALALGFMLAAHWSSLALIYIVGASLFSVSAFFNAAKRAAIPNIARGADELLTANSLTASTTAATIAVGSALGGIVATFLGRDIVFVLNAATFLASAAMIWRLKGATQLARASAKERIALSDEISSSENLSSSSDKLSLSSNDEASLNKIASPNEEIIIAAQQPKAKLSSRVIGALRRVFYDFRDGLRYVSGDATLAAVFIVAAGWGLGNGAARALYSLFGARLGVETAQGLVARPVDFGISILFVAMGAGGAFGAPLARRFNRQSDDEGLGARMGRSMFFDGAALALFSFMPNLWLAALVLVAREMNYAVWWTAQQTLMMRRTEDRFAGRVFASFETLTTLMMVAAMLASGLAADARGIRPVAAAGGAIIALSGAAWFALRRRNAKHEGESSASQNSISDCGFRNAD